VPQGRQNLRVGRGFLSLPDEESRQVRPRGVLPSPEVAFGLDGLCTLTRARGRPEEGETIRGKQLNGERTGVLQFGGKLDGLTRGTDGDGAGRCHGAVTGHTHALQRPRSGAASSPVPKTSAPSA